jgi:hypothetical protein
MKFNFKKIMLVGVILTMSSIVNIAKADIIFQQFGQFNPYTGGGTGIPNDAVATTSYTFGEENFTIGLTATERFNNEDVTNDGAGTFFAKAGSNTPPGASVAGATWGFGFFLGMEAVAFDDFSALQTAAESYMQTIAVDIYYDVDPTSAVDYGIISLWELIKGSAVKEVQDTQNLLFSFLNGSGSSVPGITRPSLDFNPNISGEYSFKIVSTTMGQLGNYPESNPLAEVGINVVVVPEPSTLALFGLGLMALASRRFKKRS